MSRRLPPLTLVLGGARSGKSRHAEGLIAALRPPWTYIATSQAFDEEMVQRIALHRQRRDKRWLTVEEPVELPRGAWKLRARQVWLSPRSKLRGDLGGILATIVGALLGLVLFIPLAYLYRFYTVSDPLRRPKSYLELNQASIISDWNLYQALRQQDRPLGKLSPVALLLTRDLMEDA